MHLFKKPDSEIKQLSNELFCTRWKLNLRENNNDLGIAIGKQFLMSLMNLMID